MQTTFVRQEPKNESEDLGVARAVFPAANGNGNGNGNANRALLEALAGSKLYHDYERAFSEATGLAVSLRPVESWQLPLHGKRHENPFCQMMAQKSRACAACLQVTETLSQRASEEPQTVTCMVGMC